MYVVVLIVIALIVAAILQAKFSSREIPGGYWNILVGALIGSWIGDIILGDWAWMLAGYNVIAGIIGSFIIGSLYILIVAKK